MECNNFVLKKWLLRVGTVRRQSFLKKLKNGLEAHGLTKQQVYKGLLQLVTRSQVLLTRSSITETLHPRSQKNGDTKESPKFPAKKSFHKETVDVGKKELLNDRAASPISRPDESNLTQATARCETAQVSSDATTIAPELLDEVVGNSISPILGRRKSIVLRLNAHEPATAPKGRPHVRPGPEIRIADSSIPDEAESVQDSSRTRNSKEDRSMGSSSPKRPRIIEDVTTNKRVIFAKSSFPKLLKFSGKTCPAQTTKNTEAPANEKLVASVTTNALDRKSEMMKVKDTRQYRLREKLRHFFGKTLSPSESEEEDGLINLANKRRKESRMSMDSGVCLSETASERVSASPDVAARVNRHESTENRCSPVHEKISSIGNDNKTRSKSNPLVRSMPLLDPVSSENTGNEVSPENMPDSSTNIENNPATSVDNGSSRILKILITPMDAMNTDAFDPMSLERNLTSQSQVSTASSTTQCLSPEMAIENNNNAGNPDDLSKLLEMDLNTGCRFTLRGNTIRIQENNDASVISSDVASTEKEAEAALEMADNALIEPKLEAETGETTCESSGQETGVGTDSAINSENLDERTTSSSTETCVNGENINDKDQPEMTISPEAKSCDDNYILDCRDTDRTVVSSVTEPCDNSDKPVEFQDKNQTTLSSAATSCVNEKLNPAVVDQTTMISSVTDKTDGQTSSKILDSPAEPERIVIKNELTDGEKLVSSEERINADDAPKNTEFIDTEEPTSPILGSPVKISRTKSPAKPLPKLRVVHHSELGSRWCPTPVNNNVPPTNEPDKYHQYQTLLPAPCGNPPQFQSFAIQGTVQPVNQLQHLQSMVLNPMPMSTPNSSNFTRGQPPNNYNITKPPTYPPPYPPPDYSSRHLGTSSAKTPSTSARNVQPNLPKYPIPATGIPPSQLMMNNCWSYLMTLNTCIERWKCGPNTYGLNELQQNFATKRNALFQELYDYCVANGLRVLDNVIRYMVRYYDSHPLMKNELLTFERIRYILNLQNLPPCNSIGHVQPMLNPLAGSSPPYYIVGATSNIVTSQSSPQSTPPIVTVPEGQLRSSGPPSKSTRPRPAPKTAAKRKPFCPQTQPSAAPAPGSAFSPEQLKTFHQQVIDYIRIDHITHLLLSTWYRKQEAENRRAVGELPMSVALRNLFSINTANREIKHCNAPTVAIPLGDNIANEQPELRHNSVDPSSQQRNVGSHRRVIYSASTFVPPANHNTAGNPADQYISAASERIVTSQHLKIADSAVNGNAALDLRHNHPNSVLRFTSRMCSPVQPTAPGSSAIIQTNPEEIVQRVPAQKITIDNSKNNPVFIVNSDMPSDLPQSPAASTPLVESQEPVIFNNSNDVQKSADKDCAAASTEERLEFRPSDPSPINEIAASGNSDIIVESSENRCTVTIADMLVECDRLSLQTKNNGTKETNVSGNSVASDENESPSTATGDTSNAEICETEKRNDDTNYFHCEKESVKSEANQMPLVVINDDDDDDDDEEDDYDYVEIVEPVNADSEVTLDSSETIKQLVIDEETVNSDDSMASVISCESTGTSRNIEDETTGMFSIFDVKSISKDVFNNMRDVDTEPSSLPPEMEQSMRINSSDVNEEILSNCFVCDKRSFVACEQCCLAFYCSIGCQRKHWADTHHKTCKFGRNGRQ